jgi:methionyl-tRNA formyltransferase
MFFKLAQIRYPQKAFEVSAFAKRYQIPVTRTASIKKNEIITYISSLQPDLIVSVSCPQMIGKKILQSAVLGGINIHSSLLPKFAGLAPYYWVLAENEKETGITVHYMTLKFDQGNILAQSKTKISPRESAFALFCKLSAAGTHILHQSVEMALAQDSGEKQDLSGYSYFSNPSFKSYVQFKKNGFALFRFSELIKSINLVD